MIRSMAVSGLMSLLAVAGWTMVTHGEELTPQVYAKLHQELQPSPDAAWRTIPWKIALLDAQKAAAMERKPIFVWAMDGHPLGCT